MQKYLNSQIQTGGCKNIMIQIIWLKFTTEWKQNNKIQRINWPSNSPDLEPIEQYIGNYEG